MLTILFLSSGLFLGWSLGANDAANIFGTAVGTRMIKFRTAAILCSIFVIIGAVIGGEGASHTLGKLGSINAMAGSFMVAFSAAFTIFWMTRLKLPVSTSQAIVGAIIGWNFFSGNLTDTRSLAKIVLTWFLCPFLAAIFAVLLYWMAKTYLSKIKLHLLRLDWYTRIMLCLVGIFGAYSLGANNIANVMGVFIHSTPFADLQIWSLSLSKAQQLFFLGSIAIAVGVFTYSYRVMTTVGNEIFKLSPITALVVVLSEALVLFIFASEGLEHWLVSNHLPALPLVPVSSSQAVIGAVVGIALIKGGSGFKYRLLGEIGAGWVATPVVAGIMAFFSLFFLQNVFHQQVYKPVQYQLSPPVLKKLHQQGIYTGKMPFLQEKKFNKATDLYHQLLKNHLCSKEEALEVVKFSKIESISVDTSRLQKNNIEFLSKEQLKAVISLAGKSFYHRWQFHAALVKITPEWNLKEENILNKRYNREIKGKLNYLNRLLSVQAR